ncbi:uncharacterized protein LOC124442560 isoform X2 [Xenia sp. Carnegie-2017]|nr:uncharacterized protein LOC124442560 isoform X2 [Xenia sp. Carnegie-2017]
MLRDDVDDENDDIINDIVSKYGRGDKSIKKCQTCDYEKVIYSDGVHTTESGCMMVYCEEEPFSCPNCDSSNETVNVEVNQQTVAENRAIEYDKGNDKPKPDLGEKSLGNTYKLGKKQKKKRSSIEKSMDAVLEQFRAMSNDDFERYKKLEEFKLEKEQQFQLEQMRLENERRNQEREHELKIFQLLFGNQATQNIQSTGSSSQMFAQTYVSFQQQTFGNGCTSIQTPGCSFVDSNDDEEKTYFRL